MLRIGLTGGIGAGKSTVSAMLVDHGAVLVDADKIAREVVEPGQPLLERLAETFGAEVLHPDGSLNRPALAAAAFVDSDRTAQLNGLMHPAIRDRTAEHFASHADAEIVVHDVPLLVENSMTPAYHLNLLVDVPAEVRLRRLMDSRGMDRDDAAARISRQAHDETRRAACDSSSTTPVRSRRRKLPSDASSNRGSALSPPISRPAGGPRELFWTSSTPRTRTGPVTHSEWSQS